MVDSWLLEMFPGRTLEELDSMDWYRLQRALQVRHIRHVEEMRRQLRSGAIKGDKLDQTIALEIKAHDELYARFCPDE